MKQRSKMVVGAIAVAAAVGGGSVAAFGGSGSSRGVGQDPNSDLFTPTVVAKPVPAPTTDAAPGKESHAPATVKGDGTSLASSFALFRRAQTAGDVLRAGFVSPAGLTIDTTTVRRADGVGGSGSITVAVSDDDKAVVVISEQSVAGDLTDDLIAGRVIHTDEQLPNGDMSVSGFLPDSAKNVVITTNTGPHPVAVHDNFYSEELGVDADHLPRTLTWDDIAGHHEQDIHLSPDLNP